MMTNKQKSAKQEQLNGSFFVNTLGVVFDPKERKILIGKREEDPFIKELTWSFPGGKLKNTDNVEKNIEEIIKEKTGLKAKSLGCISSAFARIPKENEMLLLLYYLCEVIGGKEAPKDDLVELKWVKPEELEKHFTTSFDKRLKEYILNLK